MDPTVLVICLIVLLLLIAVLLAAVILTSSSSVPKYHKKNVDFDGGADISSGHIVSSQNQLQLTNKIKGTILISVDGEIQGINNAPNSFFVTIRRVEDGAMFSTNIADRVILGRYQSPAPYGVCCISPNRDVSKFHCCLWRRNDGAVMISDNNSTNHTYVNGHRIEADTVLNCGDIIRLGSKCELQIM